MKILIAYREKVVVAGCLDLASAKWVPHRRKNRWSSFKSAPVTESSGMYEVFPFL